MLFTDTLLIPSSVFDPEEAKNRTKLEQTALSGANNSAKAQQSPLINSSFIQYQTQ